MPGTIAVEAPAEGVALVRISNPIKKNALDHAMCSALAHAIGTLAPARAAVIVGEGDAFCAGFDLAEVGDLPAAQRSFGAVVQACETSAIPLVAALTGPAFGGGCHLAALCDQRVAHPRVTLAMPPARLGIIYPPRGLARFAAICGESRARALFLRAQVVDGVEAHRWGLVDELVPPEQVLSRAIEIAGQIARLVPEAVQGMRRQFEDRL
jgi:enoyl-CoA hydratase/carnithine racemase